jgi:hypothetical protein
MKINIFCIYIFIFLFLSANLFAQENEISNKVVFYQKKEITKGWLIDGSHEEEEYLSDETYYKNKGNYLGGKYEIQSNTWNLLDYKQDHLFFDFQTGLFGGIGEVTEESANADQNLLGIRAKVSADYETRFYYNTKDYTLISVNAWGRYDVYNENLNGTVLNSSGQEVSVNENNIDDKLRYGLTGKLSAGHGRMSPMNHLMTAHYLLEKYYPGRIFSDYEIARFASLIADIKAKRDYKTGHDTEKEMKEIIDFINGKMLLESPESMTSDWDYAEFDPRFEGSRIEFGPYFQYYNKQPDFIYGGYIQYEKAKYVDVHWNMNILANITYGRYTKKSWDEITYEEQPFSYHNESQDWFTGELKLGWSYYPDLKSQFDFGISYVPGVETSSFDDFSSFSHNVVPYIGYFTQLNAKSRIKFNMEWRIADDKNFVVPGPEFSLAIYRSKY